MDGHKRVSGLSRGCPLWVILWVLLNGWEKGPWRNRPDEKGRVGAGLFVEGAGLFHCPFEALSRLRKHPWIAGSCVQLQLHSPNGMEPFTSELVNISSSTVYILLLVVLIARFYRSESSSIPELFEQLSSSKVSISIVCCICDDPALLISTIHYGQSVVDQVHFAVLLATRCFRQPSPCW